MASDGPSQVEQRAQETIEALFSQLLAQGDRDYQGEKVSQLAHSLQAAHLARQAGADNETVLAALLHDIGHFIPMYADMPAMIAPNGSAIGRGSHDVFGEKYLRQLGFSEKICGLVGAHVMAKRFLTATDGEYYDALSERSKQTLRLQVWFDSVAVMVASDVDDDVGGPVQWRWSPCCSQGPVVGREVERAEMGWLGEGTWEGCWASIWLREHGQRFSD